MRIKVVLNILGTVLKYLGAIMFIPIIFALLAGEKNQIFPFLICALSAITAGFLLTFIKINKTDINNVKKSEAFLIVVLSWAIFGFICTIPYLFYDLSPINALFEAFSGVTTTGASVLVDYTLFPKTFFFFRSMTQWLGGMGIIVLFVAILPKFSVAGRQMFFAEIPNPVEEKFTPRIHKTAMWLWSMYLFFTISEILLLKFIGKMDFYNAICCSLSTISSGGFMTNSASIMEFGDTVKWIIMCFMFLSGCNFILVYKVLIQRKIKALLKSEEFLTYLSVVLITAVIITFILIFSQDRNIITAFPDALFQTISVITTTGFSSVNYNGWNIDAKIILFLLFFLGTCVVSTSGGIKLLRWVYIFKYLKKEISKIVHPQAVYPLKLEGAAVQKDVGAQILAFVIFYITFFFISTLIVGLIEENTTVAISGSISSLGNVGTAFGNIIGPMGSFDNLTVGTKLIFIFNMFLGRLEIIPVLALLHKDSWKDI